MGSILGGPLAALDHETARPDFSAPVISLVGTRFWLGDHIKAYKRGRRWSPVENAQQLDSLRGDYLTVEEVSAITGLNRAQISKCRRGPPPPAVRVSARLLWLRSQVQNSTAALKPVPDSD